MRADLALVERGLAATRSQAQRLIADGVRWRWPHAPTQWRTVAKNGDEVPDLAELEVLNTAQTRFVSRGGLKLEGALAHTGQTVQDMVCLDVGQSTGGFTDCLLQAGALAVLGVDVGHAQLHPRLAQHPQVLALEKINARDMDAARLQAAVSQCAAPSLAPVWQQRVQAGFGLVVGDVSFISLAKVLPALVPLMAPQGVLLMLVKPQFEVGPAHIGKGGLVKDASVYPEVAQRLQAACTALGLQVTHWLDSPIAGGDGNKEFFIRAQLGPVIGKQTSHA